MNLRPVIERELRVAARQRSTYNNRTAPGILLIIVSAVGLIAGSRTPGILIGSQLFGVLNTVIFCLVWLTVPLSTADCLSREKREDTLGLLLLTPLRPVEVVVSKMFRALWEGGMFALAAVPMLAIPILLGGVTPFDLMRATLSLVTALISAVTVGILASSICERRGRAWLVVLLIGALWLTIQLMSHGVLSFAGYVASGGQMPSLEQFSTFEFALTLSWAGWVMESGMGTLLSSQFGATFPQVIVSGVLLVGTVFVSLWVIVVVSRRVRRYAESRFLTARQEKIQTVFTREQFATNWLRRGRKRLLDQNPIAWLQNRRWSHRLVKWGWLLAAVGLITAATFDRGYGFIETVILTAYWLGIFMLFSLLLISSSNLQSERDSGALELLLVTPLTPVEFARGRLISFRKSFLPAAALIVFSFWYYALLEYQTMWTHARPFQFFGPNIALTLFFTSLIWFMPAIGLCFSLNRPGLLAAVLNTAFFAVIIPWLMLPAMVGIGVATQAATHEPPEARIYTLWLWPMVWIAATGAIQLAFWRAAKTGRAGEFACLMPRWFRRWKFGWIFPWLIPVGAFLFAEWSPDISLPKYLQSDDLLFMLWQASALILLAFLGRRCWLALIRTLEERSFAGTGTGI